MTDYKKLAVLFLRATGLLWSLGGLVSFVAYIPTLLDSRNAKGDVSLFNTLMLPHLGTVVAGVALVILAGPLGRFVARDLG